jgi:sec-independent protein translocase protein TatA
MNVMFAAMLGGWEIVLILAVVLILFGAKKLPELAKGLGSGIKEFKKATRDVSDEISNAMDDSQPPPRRISQTAQQPEKMQASSDPADGPKA